MDKLVGGEAKILNCLKEPFRHEHRHETRQNLRHHDARQQRTAVCSIILLVRPIEVNTDAAIAARGSEQYVLAQFPAASGSSQHHF